MGFFQTLFSFSGRINRKRFFWASSFIGIPSALFFWFLIATTVGFDSLLTIKPGSAKAESLALTVLIYLGSVSYIHSALFFKRIRDTRHGSTISWLYMVILFFVTLLTAGNVLAGKFTGGGGIGIMNLVAWGLWFVALTEKSVSLSPNSPENSAFQYGEQNVPADLAAFDRNDDADAIIARAVAERQAAMNAQQQAPRPSPVGRPKPVSFGNRSKPDFGQRC